MKKTLISVVIAVAITACAVRRPDPPLAATSVEDQKHRESWEKAEREIDAFKKAHPIRPSAELTSAMHIIRLLVRMETGAANSCSIDPDFPEWSDAAKSLKENTKVALQESAFQGQQDFYDAYTVDQQILLRHNADLCISKMDAVYSELRSVAGLMQNLKRHGY
jgi:hypothetical protein